MAFELPKLPYDYSALEPIIDEATMHLHHEKHHAGYVDKLNSALAEQPDLQNLSITDLMHKVDTLPEAIQPAIRNNGGGHANHSLFWEILQPMSSDTNQPSGELAEAIASTFDNFDNFVNEFNNAATTRFGSGWAWLTVENGTLHVCSTPNQDNPWMKGNTPILGLDVWEHAYYLKYQNRRAEYVENFWKLVNWDKVAENFKAAK